LTYFEMQLLRDAIFRRQAAVSPSGQILTRALLDEEHRILPRYLHQLPPAAIRRFIGDDAADMLEVPPAGAARVLMTALGPFGVLADRLAQGRVLREMTGGMTKSLFQSWIDRAEGGGRSWEFEGARKALRIDAASTEVDIPAEEQLEDAVLAGRVPLRPPTANGRRAPDATPEEIQLQ
jgi:hypothetical protein